MSTTYPRILDFEARVVKFGESEEETVEVKGVPFNWNPDSLTLDSAAYWKAARYLHDMEEFEWISIVSWATKPAKEKAS